MNLFDPESFSLGIKIGDQLFGQLGIEGSGEKAMGPGSQQSTGEIG
jgi:hypothetical protein